MVEVIQRAMAYLQPLENAAALQRDQLVQDAIVRNIEIIGEGATQ